MNKVFLGDLSFFLFEREGRSCAISIKEEVKNSR